MSQASQSELKTSSDIEVDACEREPIHIPGAIQPHGVLIALQPPAWTITHVSANAHVLFGKVAPQALLGTTLEQVLPAKIVHDLRNTFQAANISGYAERVNGMPLGDNDEPHDLLVHSSGALAIIEVMPRSDSDVVRGDPIVLVKVIIDRLRRTTTFQSFLASAARQIRAISGYDRVMIYRFLEDDSGRVVAEALRSGLPPYLHLHYPASDIPAQARALYKRQWLRLIPTVDYKPVPIIPATGEDDLPLDLTLAGLRSVSPVHLQYLRNMGSAATLTVSIMRGDHLWGLIACHHETPRNLAATTCAAVELFAQVFSSQIEAKEQQDQLIVLANSREAHDKLIGKMDDSQTVMENLRKHGDLLREIIDCDGIGVWMQGRFEGEGVTPPANAISEIIRFLSTKPHNRIFATRALSDEIPDAFRYARDASGLLAIPLSSAPRDFILLFRREVEQTVLWGGDPTKPVTRDQPNVIGPRKSFAAWREIVRGKSLPWSASTIDIAGTLRVSLLDVILRRANHIEREQRIAQESQELLVAELNHRIKNILAVIGSLARQGQQSDNSIEAFTSNLQSRIQALSIAHDQLTRTQWRSAPLRTLIEAEARAWSDFSEDRLILSGPPVMIEARAYQTLALVLHEMMTNAAKYGAFSVPDGCLTITWRLDKDLTLLWSETNGPLTVPPTRRGFGTVVIEQSIPFELRGTASITYPPEGVQAEFSIPADFVQEGRHEGGNRMIATSIKADLAGKSLLLVEDSMMIALDAQGMLQACGAEIEIASTIDDAKRAISLNNFAAAILDINLYLETSYAIADVLLGRNIPFVFATGYGETVSMPERFQHIVVVSKPYAEDMLRAALWAAMETA